MNSFVLSSPFLFSKCPIMSKQLNNPPPFQFGCQSKQLRCIEQAKSICHSLTINLGLKELFVALFKYVLSLLSQLPGRTEADMYKNIYLHGRNKHSKVFPVPFGLVFWTLHSMYDMIDVAKKGEETSI